jgi:hypothetical protein
MGDKDETRRHRLDALIEDSLIGTLEVLRDLPESPRARDLHGRARRYREAIKLWMAVRPSQAQRAALRELVHELHQNALELYLSEALTPVQGIPSARSPRAN